MQRGTYILRFRPLWSTADYEYTGSNQVATLLHVFYDSNNEIRIDYLINPTSGNNRFRFRWRADSTEVALEYAADLSRDDEHVLVGRYTSSDRGELGLPARTLSFFVDGVKVDEDQHTDDIIETNTCNVYIGGESTATGSGGAWISERRFTPVVYTDEEIQEERWV